MNLRHRLRRLERDVEVGGCAACRDRRRLDLLLSGRQLPDGAVVPAEELPPPCRRCGEIPEQVVLIVEKVVGGEEDRENGIPQRR